MKNFMKIILTLVAAVLFLTACNDSGGTKLDKIKSDGKLVVYMSPDFPPFEYMKGSDPAGVDVDLANEIAKDLGVEVVLENADFDAIISALASGKGDVAISGITITEDRLKEVDFSVPYIKSVQYILVSRESDIKTMEDLAGKKVGAAMGYTGQFVLEDEIEKGVLKDAGVETAIVNSANEGSLEVINGKIDALVIDEYVAKKIAADNNELTAIKLVYNNGDEIAEEYGVAVAKGNEDLIAEINKTIERILSESLVEQWVIAHS